MKSRRGIWAAALLLLGLPVAVLSDTLLGAGGSAVIHLLFGLGFAFLSFSVFDFRTPRWITWIGSVSAGALAIIFLVQGLSELI